MFYILLAREPLVDDVVYLYDNILNLILHHMCVGSLLELEHITFLCTLNALVPVSFHLPAD